MADEKFWENKLLVRDFWLSDKEFWDWKLFAGQLSVNVYTFFFLQELHTTVTIFGIYFLDVFDEEIPRRAR